MHYLCHSQKIMFICLLIYVLFFAITSECNFRYVFFLIHSTRARHTRRLSSHYLVKSATVFFMCSKWIYWSRTLQEINGQHGGKDKRDWARRSNHHYLLLYTYLILFVRWDCLCTLHTNSWNEENYCFTIPA